MTQLGCLVVEQKMRGFEKTKLLIRVKNTGAAVVTDMLTEENI